MHWGATKRRLEDFPETSTQNPGPGGSIPLRGISLLVMGAIVLVSLTLPTSRIHAQTQTDKLCTDCHPDFQAERTGKFNHKPFAEGNCEACHRSHGFKNDVQFRGAMREVCTECHEIVEDLPEEMWHYPLTEDDGCVQCHRPHSSDERHLLAQPGAHVCLECHDAPEDREGNLHKPYADTTCLSCHDPHGSLFGHNLQLPAGYVCMGCHETILTDFTPPEMHTGNDISSCENCHHGHGTTHESLLHNEVNTLCLDCHKDIAGLFSDAPRHPILDDDNCLVCHVPHFRKGRESLIETKPALCFACHDGVRERLKLEYPHAAAEEDCGTCHDPHVPGPQADQIELCGTCHDIEDTDFVSRHYGVTPTLCTACHDPHGSDAQGIIWPNQHPPFEERACDICHKDRPGSKELRSDDLCLECHDKPDRTQAPHAQPTIADQTRTAPHCVDCHSPHAASAAHLVKPI